MTTDNFALLQQLRQPWLDPEALKTRFLALAAEVHPDRIHNASEADKSQANQRYAQLNAAYDCLRETKDRLRHLLELERGQKPPPQQNVPPATMERFAEVARLCRAVDTFLAEKRQTTSQLLQVQMFERGSEWTEKLRSLQRDLKALHDESAQELKSMNGAWGTSRLSGTLDRLEELYRHFSFIARWTEQIQERLVQLSI